MKIIRSRAPLRLGFAGGGSDLKVYSDKYGGAVINTTISLYVNCNIKYHNSRNIVFESIDGSIKTEYEINKKIEFDGKLDIYKAIHNKIHERFSPKKIGFHLSTYSEVPSGSGLGGSSTLVVSILTAFLKLYNISLNKYDIAKLAYQIEREDMYIVGGQQDQYASVFGGFNFIEFKKDKSIEVIPLKINHNFLNELESSMVLYYTNIRRNAGQIEKEKTSLLTHNDSLQSMHLVKNSAIKMKEFLLSGNILEIAKLTDLSWRAKKSVSPLVSNHEIEQLYSTAVSNGAIGGKISGAGGGGFMFFYVQPENKFKLINALNNENGYVINFNFSPKGSESWLYK